ncbi:MAG TPA: hypothetical protein VJT31_10255 [Rugosimonospora sp.]|nr:hypothetical protein [Rugosimonospora sp.]
MTRFTVAEAVPGAGMLPASVPAPTAPPVEALRRQTGALLQYCYRWLEQAVPVLPQLADAVPALVIAVHQYEAQQYEASLAQVLGVVRALQRVRLSVPALPPL